LGLRRFIVLDLAQVGTGRGVNTLALCRRIADEVPGGEIITGGGVTTRSDLTTLA
jgi:uncharacterized protein related to proFAR isomerase